jgi:hypothetical protein
LRELYSGYSQIVLTEGGKSRKSKVKSRMTNDERGLSAFSG